MSGNLRIRAGIVLFCIALALVVLAPTVFRESKVFPSWWKKTFEPIHLGLDLQGGIHLVLGVDTDKAVESQMAAIADELDTLMKEQDIVFKRVDVAAGGVLGVVVYDEAAGKLVEDLVRKQFGNLQSLPDSRAGEYTRKNYQMQEAEVQRIKDYAVRQALETLRNRVDQFGVSEPVLQREGDDRILIQLPGLKDPKRAIDLIGKTARLEFKMVADVPEADLSRGRLPAGVRRLYERRVDRATRRVTETPIAVYDKTVLTGDLISDARVTIDRSFNEPGVSLQFNSVGAKRFDQITANNVGKRLAIVLDDVVYSAPNIRERISGGNAQITGSFTEQEATDLAIVLRAGSLPAPVHIMEDRTVGPSLGRDSINRGIFSVLLGGLLVIVIMAVYYRLSGLVANVALILNLVFMMSLLALFKASLTLPGIAGIVLTLGMAVDANVLIFERIREEVRRGQTPRLAVQEGFARAFRTILDANVTTLIAALVLFEFGTGPVKGFAVTLSVGIVSSVFTAVFVSRVIFDYFLESRKVSQLSI